jgi:SAM-dependent methyltransferase
MKVERNMEPTAQLHQHFLDEYVSDDAVRKYTTQTAGYGITYLLNNDYAGIYLNVIERYLLPSSGPLRLLEFGCGAGMNIIHLLWLLAENKVSVERAYGTDFSPRLVLAADEEAKASLPRDLAENLSFHVARNETLVEDLSTEIGGKRDLLGSFDLIIGVNTIRYCHRLGKALDCVADIYSLLRLGGVCINIDMNNRFPAFRSRLKLRKQNQAECYLPSLEEYVSPFKATGFEVMTSETFCWIPHSAGRSLTLCCRLSSPLLNIMARSRAMRSLVVARKPA